MNPTSTASTRRSCAQFIARVRALIGNAASPEEACEAIRPPFAALLADPEWLPHAYREGDPDSGMGGGIGQWLLYRAGDRSLTLFALVVPPGSETPVHDHLAWGLVGLYRRHAGRGHLHHRRSSSSREPPARSPATSTRCCRRATTSTAYARRSETRRSRSTC